MSILRKLGQLQRATQTKCDITHTHTAADLASGTVATARLGSGSATSSTFLRGDSTWATPPGGGGAAWGQITGTLADQSDLSTALAGKAASSHGHVKDDISDFTHAHAQADVASLVTDLAGKAAASHTRATGDIASGTVATARLGSGTADNTTFLRGDQTWTAAGGGSDPWTNVLLAQDFSTTATANGNVTGLAFAPSANKRYLVEVYLLLRTATATVGPRPGFAWPSGLSDGGAWLQAPNSATAFAMRSWGALNTQNAASTGVPTTTNSHLAIGGAYFITSGAPSGSFQVTLASETAGTSVTMKAGSLLRYREVA